MLKFYLLAFKFGSLCLRLPVFGAGKDEAVSHAPAAHLRRLRHALHGALARLGVKGELGRT